jgi:CheY-like chemotaxis protein
VTSKSSSLFLRVSGASRTEVAVNDSTERAQSGAQRVLVVDDNEDAAQSLAMLLQLEGRLVRVAADGADALKSFEQFQPEAVLLDIGLPDMDGYEVARRMRASAGGRKVLLIALTGWGQADDKRRAADAGFDEHLTKPLDPDFLSALLSMKRSF